MCCRYQCCHENDQLRWIDPAELCRKSAACWGPEMEQCVKHFEAFKQNEELCVFEFGHERALSFLTCESKLSTPLAKLLRLCNIDADTVLTLYQDYVEWCFPSFYMAFESFKMYLAKYSFDHTDDARLGALFRAACHNNNANSNKKCYLDLFEYITAIVCLDCTDHTAEARQQMIWRYYHHQDGDSARMSMEEFVALLRDLHPGPSDERLRKETVQQLERAFKFNATNKLAQSDFQEAIRTGLIKNTAVLCHATKKIVPQIVDNTKKHKRAHATSELDHKVKRRDRGACNGCRAQELHFCSHCMIVDSDGRCEQPNLIGIKEGMVLELWRCHTTDAPTDAHATASCRHHQRTRCRTDEVLE